MNPGSPAWKAETLTTRLAGPSKSRSRLWYQELCDSILEFRPVTKIKRFRVIVQKCTVVVTFTLKIKLLSLLKEAFESRVEDRRRRGSPKLEWEQYVSGMARRRGKGIQELRYQNRERYRKLTE